MKKSIAYLIATWFKSGLSPKAPGTVGSVCSLPLAWFLPPMAELGALSWEL